MINNLVGTGLVLILIRITATFGLRGDDSGSIMETTWLELHPDFNQVAPDYNQDKHLINILILIRVLSW